MEQFQPNANNILDVLYNKKPKYLPLYEHHIDIEFIEKFTGEELIGYRETEPEYFFKKVTEFWKNNTYDAFDFEAPICDVFPEHGAIMGGKLGPIQTRSDFERYPFDEIPHLFWEANKPKLGAIRKVLPTGMKAYGGCGYGIFERTARNRSLNGTQNGSSIFKRQHGKASSDTRLRKCDISAICHTLQFC